MRSVHRIAGSVYSEVAPSLLWAPWMLHSAHGWGCGSRGLHSEASTPAPVQQTIDPLPALSSSRPLPGWLGKTVVAPPIKAKSGGMLSWMFTRVGADGKKTSMPTWERAYWGIGVMGLSAFMMSRSSYFSHNKDDGSKEKLEAEKAKKEALEKRRTDMIRAMVAGKSFLDDDSPFEGMSPKDIQNLVASAKAERAMQGLQTSQSLQSYQGLQGSQSLRGLHGSQGLQETKGRAMVRQQAVVEDDPFEGMSPDEIDEYVLQYGLPK